MKISFVKQSSFASNKHSLVPVPTQGEYGQLTSFDTVVARRKTCEIIFAYLLIGTNCSILFDNTAIKFRDKFKKKKQIYRDYDKNRIFYFDIA